jgi:hypothetical protein
MSFNVVRRDYSTTGYVTSVETFVTVIFFSLAHVRKSLSCSSSYRTFKPSSSIDGRSLAILGISVFTVLASRHGAGHPMIGFRWCGPLDAEELELQRR